MSGAGGRKRSNLRLGALLRRAREKLGLSQRQLAERMDVSWVSVSNAENGADLHHGTLRQFLRALPGLTPQELLCGPATATTQTRADVWSYYRDLIGLEADRVERELIIHANGDREDFFRCSGLRSVRENPSEVRLLDGLESAVFQGQRPLLEELRAERAGGEGDEPGMRSRVLEKAEGRFLHRFTVPADLAKDGLTYSWRRRRIGGDLWREQAKGFEPGKTERIHHGGGYRVTLPSARLTVRLRFPADYWPEIVYLRTWPSATVPDPRVRDFTELLHPEGLKLRKDRRRRVVSLMVDHPLIDWSYNIGWVLPPRPGG
jgi:transcriptional regulator with XRE-family HTH domain